MQNRGGRDRYSVANQSIAICGKIQNNMLLPSLLVESRLKWTKLSSALLRLLSPGLQWSNCSTGTWTGSGRSLVGQSIIGSAGAGTSAPVPDCDCAANCDAEPAAPDSAWLERLPQHPSRYKRALDFRWHCRRAIVRSASFCSWHRSERTG